MKTKYDLTNREELRSVIEYLSVSNPLLSVGKYFFDKIFSTDTTKAQQEAAKALIKEGKKSGVKTMDIDIDNTRGIDLNVPEEGVNIKTTIGANEKMHIHVEYE